MKALSLIAAALLLTACGGGGRGYGDGASMPPPAATPPTATGDAFFSQVLKFVGSQSESEEAADITAVGMTEPQDTEPVPL